MIPVRRFLSPNFNERPTPKKVDLIVIHYTGMVTAQAALTRLCEPAAQVSSHYLIEKNGYLHELVDEKKRAWHAGISFWKGETDINGISLGIELDNGGHDFGLPAYPEDQIKTLLLLLDKLVTQYSLHKERIIGHSDVAPTRKRDPGEHFPWLVLHKKGFGLWPESCAVNPEPQSIYEIQKKLGEIGYNCPFTGILDLQTTATIKAFQQHFTPQEITGTPTPNLRHTLSCFKS